MMRWFRCKKSLALCSLSALLSLALILSPRETSARVRLESICSIAGQKEQKLTGIGLVIGLEGTGDGGKNKLAMRALAAMLKLDNNHVENIAELKNADNVAIVKIEATIPKTGLRRGQKIDCYISSLLSASSLKNGRLLVAPVETAEIGDDTVVGLASGGIVLEGTALRTGVIKGGVTLETDFISSIADKRAGEIISLLLDTGHSSFYAANEVARVIRQDFELEGGVEVKATGAGVIDVKIPERYDDSLVEFLALLLDITIENPHTQGRVVVNTKTGTVVVTGEVEISPVMVSHRNLVVEIGGISPGGGRSSNRRFAALPVIDDQSDRQTPESLKTLVEALNQLQVSTDDIIAIIRELHRSGKLHAVYDEH